MMHDTVIFVFCALFALFASGQASFYTAALGSRVGNRRRFSDLLEHDNRNDDQQQGASSLDTFSKAMVSRLTDVVNMFGKEDSEFSPLLSMLPPPSTPTELLERIRGDYVVRNYLWTGNLDLGCFEQDCKFSDPTLSFIGRKNFVQNVKNLRVIVDRLISQPNQCKSLLFDVCLKSDCGYLESHWNMIGQLDVLPWKPKIDVIGKTKFWYREQDDGIRVYWYDERWEVPPWMALLQLITTAGTIPNSLLGAHTKNISMPL